MRFAVCLALAFSSHAAVRRVDIVDRTPAAHNYERVTGRVRSEFVPDHTVTSMPLGDRIMDPIPVAKALALYVRDSGDLPSRKIASDQWKLGVDGKSVDMPAGFEAAKLYEFAYEGKDPV